MGLGDALNIRRGQDVRDRYVKDRFKKSLKISMQVRTRRPVIGARVLDFGAGTGLIARHFADEVGPAGEVIATDISRDILDEAIDAGVKFKLIADGRVDEGDGSIDIIISNHVVEHVGPTDDQLFYLKECCRMMNDDAILYLATPNRWSVFEPHYRLPFVSWWPASWRSGYLRLLRRFGISSTFGSPMDRYDVWPLSRREARHLLEKAGFAVSDVTRQTAESIIEIELSGTTRAFARIVLPLIWRPLSPIVPTHVFLCEKSGTR